jgi:hypothetical protein
MASATDAGTLEIRCSLLEKQISDYRVFMTQLKGTNSSLKGAKSSLEAQLKSSFDVVASLKDTVARRDLAVGDLQERLNSLIVR